MKLPEIDPIQDETLINELEPAFEIILDEHYASSKGWAPYELINYDEARNFNSVNPWKPEDYPISDALRSAIYVNLLTEDNLPYYSNTLLELTKDSKLFYEWIHTWIMEEHRHPEAIRNWVYASRAIDPKFLENGRIKQMSKGEVPEPLSRADMFIYTAMQELATQVAHRNTGRALPTYDKTGKKVMGYVAGDEFRHHVVNSDTVVEGLKITPNHLVFAAHRQIMNFKMPGTGIPDFETHSKLISDIGIYGIEQFLEGVLQPVLDKWKLEDVSGLNAQAEQAIIEINKRAALLGRIVLRQKEKESLTV